MQARNYVPGELRTRLLAAAPPDLELSFRPMFGGIMGYTHGRPFVSLSDVGLAFKLGSADHVDLLTLPGARPLQYEPSSPPSKSYVIVPDRVLDDPVQLATWAGRSAGYVAKQPVKRLKRAASKMSRRG